jgi:hypothetical protein
MSMNSEAKHGGSGGGDLETRVTVIEKTMIAAEVFQREIGALRDEMRAGFAEMRKEFVELRKDMQVGFANVRKEMEVGFADVRKEMQVGFANVRKEMDVGFAEVRKEMEVGFADVRKEMQAQDGALRVEIAKTPFETFKWLLAAGGLAAAIATAIYNSWFR